MCYALACHVFSGIQPGISNKRVKEPVFHRVVLASQDFLKVLGYFIICITLFWPRKAYRDSLLNVKM